jgi:hypothetical protein
VGEHNVKSWPEFATEDAALARIEPVALTQARFFRAADEHAEAWGVAGAPEAESANRRTRKRLAAHRALAKVVQTIRCAHREFCTNPDCTFAHSKKEIAFFQAHGGASPFKLQKTQTCTTGRCARPALWKLCTYHHAGEPRFCRICLGAPCLKAVCKPDFERPLLRMNDERYRDLVSRNYLQSK